MNRCSIYGKLRLKYLQENNPDALAKMEEDGLLDQHLRQSQQRAIWEYEQLLFSGMDEQTAKEYILSEYIYS